MKLDFFVGPYFHLQDKDLVGGLPINAVDEEEVEVCK